MKVTILDELWLTESDGRFALGTPTVVRQDTGAGVPGLVVPRPFRVFKPGEVVMLAMMPPCGCTSILRYDSGTAVLQHSCGQGWGQ